jgi:hypothetical protein
VIATILLDQPLAGRPDFGGVAEQESLWSLADDIRTEIHLAGITVNHDASCGERQNHERRESHSSLPSCASKVVRPS